MQHILIFSNSANSVKSEYYKVMRLFHVAVAALRRCYTRQFFLQIVPQLCCVVARQDARNVA